MLKRFLLFSIIFIMLLFTGCASFIENQEYNDGIYSGDWLNEQPHGNGTAVFELDDGTIITYEGKWKNGLRHGYGTQKNEQSDGAVLTYEGNWLNNKKNGDGTQIYTRNDGDKIIYNGVFLNDSMQGQGAMLVTMNIDGNIKYIEYEGEFKNGKRNGQGTETEKDSEQNIISERSGLWVNDKFIG